MNERANVQDLSVESLLGQAADEFSERLSRGESPDVEEYAQRYPQVAELIRQVFPALSVLKIPPDSQSQPDGQILEPAGTRCLGDFRIIREIGRGGMGVVYEAEQESLGRRVALKVLPFAAVLDPKHLKRFQNEARAAASLRHPNIVQVHSVGCERAVHFYAMDYVEGQTLAEVIRDLRRIEGMDEEEAAGRRSEVGKIDEQVDSRSADSLASGQFAPPKRGSDPNGPTTAYAQETTPDVAEDTGPQAQAAVSTERSTKSPAYFRSIAEIGVQVAEALDHAHEHGVIHRDVKPSNVILDAEGKAWVTDFGLARIEADAALTLTGDLLGTVRYMSPEQALAKRIVVDHRTDVYSLGVTLYELLTLEPALTGEDHEELLRQVAFEEPRRPRRINRAIPSELETIVLKAIAKSPSDRYATAQGLADDLNRFLEDKPIVARRPSLVHRAAKWARRHRWAVTVVAICASILVLLSVVLLAVSNVQISNALGAQRRANDTLERTLYSRRIELAVRELAVNSVRRAKRHLDECPIPLRDWEWRHLKWRVADRSLRTMTGHQNRVTQLAFAPDGRHVASSSWDGTVRIWDVDTGAPRLVLAVPKDEEHPMPYWGHPLAYRSDGRRLATASGSRLHLWNSDSGKLELELPTAAEDAHQGLVSCVAFTPDGSQILSSGFDRTMKLWDAEAGKCVRTLGATGSSSGEFVELAVDPTGKWVVTGDMEGTLELWEVETGQLRWAARGRKGRNPSGHELGVSSVAFSRDGKRIVSGSWDTSVRVWDAGTGEHRLTIRDCEHWIGDVAFNHDGSRIVGSCADNCSKVWDTSTGERLLNLRGHTGPASAATFSPDGNWVVTASSDHTVKLWDASPRTELRTLAGHQGIVSCVAMDPQSEWIVSGDLEGELLMWSTATGQKETLARHWGEVHCVAISPDGQWIAAGGDDAMVRIWHRTNRAERAFPKREDAPRRKDAVYGLDFGPDSRRLASAGGDGVVNIWDVETGEIVRSLKGHTDAVNSVAFSRDGQWLAAGSDDATCTVWSVQTGESRCTFRGHAGPVTSVAYHPDGRCVVSCCMFLENDRPGEAKLWDPETGQGLAVTLETLGTPLSSVAFNPQGTRIVAGAYDRSLLLFDAATGQEVFRARNHKAEVDCAVFSPDGRLIVSGGADGMLKIWECGQ